MPICNPSPFFVPFRFRFLFSHFTKLVCVKDKKQKPAQILVKRFYVRKVVVINVRTKQAFLNLDFAPFPLCTFLFSSILLTSSLFFHPSYIPTLLHLLTHCTWSHTTHPHNQPLPPVPHSHMIQPHLLLYRRGSKTLLLRGVGRSRTRSATVRLRRL